jgi:hypothetical protein
VPGACLPITPDDILYVRGALEYLSAYGDPPLKLPYDGKLTKMEANHC